MTPGSRLGSGKRGAGRPARAFRVRAQVVAPAPAGPSLRARAATDGEYCRKGRAHFVAKSPAERVNANVSSLNTACPVALRNLTPSDLRRIEAWLQDQEIRRLYVGSGPRRNRTARALGIWRRTPDESSPLIGWVEIDDINRRAASAELRVCLGRKDLWGRGYGTAAVRLALDHAFSHLNLRQVYLRVATDNERAIRAYAKCGFTIEGVLRAGRHAALGMRDHFLMTLRRPPDGEAAPAVASARIDLAARRRPASRPV